jgi:ADP-ribose pyrophosphatase YjhB (NUDIX family)
MTNHQYPLVKKEFDDIYSKVPRLTVEIILRNKGGEVYMTKRAIEPCKGQWHLPGGTVYFGESLLEAVRRVALRELGIKVQNATNTGYIEYPSHYLNGLDSPVGIVFEVTSYTGEPKVDDEAIAGNWFSELPANTHADQDTFLIQNDYLTN